MIHTTIIATKFVRNKRVLHKVISQLSNCNPIQITHNGGISATAIATHAILSESFLNPRERTAITQEASAIKRSTIVGEVLERISLVMSAKGTARVIR